MTRLAVLSEQYNIELQTARSANPLAVFFTPTLPTPLFIDPDAITKNVDGLFILKAGHENAIPDGLIPAEKLNDPAQLSTVLARVISMHIMLASGVKLILFHVDTQRPKANGKNGFVDDSHIKKLESMHSHQVIRVTITREIYEDFKSDICAATYSYNKEGESEVIGIEAQQIHTAKPHETSAVHREEAAQKKVDQLNILMMQPGIREQLCSAKPPRLAGMRDALFGNPVNPPHAEAEDTINNTSLPKSPIVFT